MEENTILQASPIVAENLIEVFQVTFAEYKVYIAIIVSLLIILCTAGIYLKTRRSKGHALVLMGVNESGKTALFIKLVHDKFMETYTSMAENRSWFNIKDAEQTKLKSLELIDIPGYDKLRFAVFDKVKHSIRAIVFMVDGSTVSNQIKIVTECLYCILIDDYVRSKRIPILVASNKMDLKEFKNKDFVKQAFEKEINHLRQTRSNALQSTDGKTYATEFIGKRSKNYSFEDDKKINIDFLDVSVKDEGEDEDGLEALKAWVWKIYA